MWNAGSVEKSEQRDKRNVEIFGGISRHEYDLMDMIFIGLKFYCSVVRPSASNVD